MSPREAYESVTAPWVRHLVVSGATSLKVQEDVLLNEFGFSPRGLSHPAARISVDVQDQLWVRIADEAGSQNLATIAANACLPGALGITGVLMATSATVKGAAAIIDRYRRLVGPHYVVPVVAGDETRTIMTYNLPPTLGQRRERGEVSLLSALLLTRKLTTDHELRPIEARFQHPRPRDMRWYDQWFDCPKRFDCSETTLVLRMPVLQPLLQSDPAAGQLLEALAMDLLSRLPARVTRTREVHEYLARWLPLAPDASAESIGLERTARALRVAPRTLQRQLGSEGITFDVIVEKTRQSLAESLLLRAEIPIKAIPKMLGYESLRSFYRAFHRAHSVTPKEFQLRHRTGPLAHEDHFLAGTVHGGRESEWA